MNRVVVINGLIITSPVTADITGIFDTMDGNSPSVLDNEMCQALADSLGDVLVATITTPERVINSDLSQEQASKFDFTVPADWGVLEGYEMAALGYRADGDERYFDIALYYTDKDAAEDACKEIINRMNSYTLNTWVKNLEAVAFTDRFQPGEIDVQKYGEGAVLKIPCQIISEGVQGVSTLLGGSAMPIRDLLFLAVDPSPYIGQNE